MSRRCGNGAGRRRAIAGVFAGALVGLGGSSVEAKSVAFDPAESRELQGPGLGAVLVRDFDLRGVPDILVVHGTLTESSEVVVYLGETEGGELPYNDSAATNAGVAVERVALGDFDDDGVPDLVAGAQGGILISQIFGNICGTDLNANQRFPVMRGVGDGSFALETCLKLNDFYGYTDTYFTGLVVEDFDGDGHEDVVAARAGNYGEKVVKIFFGSGGFAFSEPTTIYDSGVSGNRPMGLAAGDFGGDANLDLLVETSGPTYLYVGDGAGGFTGPTTYLDAWPTEPVFVDDDAYPDLVALGAGMIDISYGIAGGGYDPEIQSLALTGGTGPYGAEVADLDGDGDSDIFVMFGNIAQNVSLTVYRQSGQPACADADGDGYGDPASAACAFPDLDCDDADSLVNPGAAEVCGNGTDDDCDGLVDAADPECAPACTDSDGDGFSVEGGACGSVDCDDADAAVNPGAAEVPGNGIDDDCDGAVDETPPGGCAPLPGGGITGTSVLALYGLAASVLALGAWRRRALRGAVAAAVFLATAALPRPADAALTFYTNEGAYLAALASLGAAPVVESFEDDVAWGAVRSTIPGGHHTAPSVTNLGVTWRSRHATPEVTTGPGPALDGAWGFFTLPHGIYSADPACMTPGVCSDGWTMDAAAPLVAFGGWVETNSGFAALEVVLDDDPTRTTDFEGEPLPIGPAKFFGVVDPAGFSRIEWIETEGAADEVINLFGDLFTFAHAAGACSDSDGDGYALEGGACGAVDCDDADPLVNPGAAEVPGNGIDDNCNGAVDEPAGGCSPVHAAAAGHGLWGAAASMGAAFGALLAMARRRRR